MIASYRDPRYAASIRIQQLHERNEDLTDGVPEEVVDIHARRVARSWAGGVAIVGAVAVVAATIDQYLVYVRFFHHPTLWLIAAVVLSLATYAAVRFFAARAFVRRVRASFAESDDELVRLARLESDGVRRAAIRLASAGEKASIGLPMMGSSLLAPLSSHLVAWCFLGSSRSGLDDWLHGFDWWIAASLILVGIAHITLVFLCWRFARRIERLSLPLLIEKNPQSGWAALGWTVLASCVPGLIALGIPVLLVLVTGIFWIPSMFNSMHRRAIYEREALLID